MRLAPFVDSRSDMDEVFDRFFGGPRTTALRDRQEVPTDIFHTGSGLVIRMDLPGVDPDAVEVTVQDNVLLVNGSRSFPFQDEDVRFLRRGTFYGDFTQRVTLGKGLKADEISANFDRGVLELRVPYAEEVQPRKISISVGRESKELQE